MNKDKILLYFSLFLSVVALANTYHPDTSTNVNQTYASKDDVVDLSRRTDANERSYRILNNEYSSLSSNYYASLNKSAFFSPTDTGFQLLNTTFGNLLVSLKNVEKHGDGYSLTFDFGNPTSISIAGLKGKIQWGPKVDQERLNKDQAYAEDMGKKTNFKDFEILNDVYPGAWNQETIMIGPATEEEIGEITLYNIESNSVKLRQINTH